MQPHEGLEREVEGFLLGIVPELESQWRGAKQEEILQIERLAGRALPPFYRWFLARMGQSMGPLTYPRLDFSAQRVLACYAEELVMPHPRFLLIGCSSDELMPLHVFYDFDSLTRADARVTKRYATGGDCHDQFETFREMLSYGAFLSFRIDALPQRCRALLRSDDSNIFSRLDPVMDKLGFRKSAFTGRSCGMYDRHDAAMICSKIPPDEPEPVMIFRLSGNDSGALRKIMGEIANEPSFSLKIREWSPPLP